MVKKKIELFVDFNYKVYTALIYQSDTSNPVINVLENSIGDIIWTRDNIGMYKGTLPRAFDVEKTICFITGCIPSDGSISSKFLYASAYDESNVIINQTFIDYDGGINATGYTDDMRCQIEIRVYE